MELLEGRGISKCYGEREVLRNAGILIPQGLSVAIAGETGSGKSTLLKILAGLLEPDEGQVLFKREKIEGPLTRLIPGHKKIAYLSQYFELRNNYRVEEIFDYSNQLEDPEARDIIKLCDVEHLQNRRTDELSGGEKQRIALARILLTKPEVLLLDEPFSNLDLIQKTALKKALSSVTNAFRLTVVLVSHDPDDILSFAEIIHIMRGGEVVQSGSPQQIYYAPADEYCAGLFGNYIIVNEPVRNLFGRFGQDIPEGIRFLRPEMLSIVRAQMGLMKGIVEDDLFLGSFRQAKVSVDGLLLLCNHQNASLRKGEIVSLKLK